MSARYRYEMIGVNIDYKWMGYKWIKLGCGNQLFHGQPLSEDFDTNAEAQGVKDSGHFR